MPESVLQAARLLLAALLAAILVAAGTFAWLARGLPEKSGEARHFEATDFKFMMGSGQADGDRVVVDGFANGYALLSSGPISIPAGRYRIFRVEIHSVKNRTTPKFFWRRSDSPGDLVQRRIRETGKVVIELAGDSGWRGDIAEFGLLFEGERGTRVTVGVASLEPDSLALRLELMWRGWTAFEGWSQKSINFLWGGSADPPVRLPVLVGCWVALTVPLVWLISVLRGGIRSRELLVTGLLMFMAGWMLLDLRWTANNQRHIYPSLQNWGLDEAQRLSQGLDGGVYSYIQRLKKDVLTKQASRILILGDANAVEYFLQRAKYHLLPNNAFAARKISSALAPNSLNYVLYFGEPPGIDSVPGWNQEWREALIQKDISEWGAVYEVMPGEF